jgi:cation diffusion facilitator CzcD-associated flavoprotein CzcO
VLHDYLRSYAEIRRLQAYRFETKVETVERQQGGGGWITLKPGNDNNNNNAGGRTQLFAHKLIIAAGLTSEPFLPDIPETHRLTPLVPL